MQAARGHRWIVAIALFGGAIGMLFWMAWLALHNPAIRFLPPPAVGQWILYPNPPDATAHPAGDSTTNVAAVFTRRFEVAAAPATALLSVQALESCQVELNGVVIARTSLKDRSWKQPLTLDVKEQLLAGINELTATVFNRAGPPLLWMHLRWDDKSLTTDGAWTVGLGGAIPQPATTATANRVVRLGNLLEGGKTVWTSIRARAGTLAIFLCLAVVGVVLLDRGWAAVVKSFSSFNGHGQFPPRPKTPDISQSLPILVTVLAGLAWVILFANNLSHWPAFAGFDAQEHVKYISFIQENWTLPKAADGWEMHQPPLYYTAAAMALSALSLPAHTEAGHVALRLFGLFIGLAQLVVVLGCLRRIFPGQARPQTIGIILAAFLPAHIYTSHYVTNETAMALLVSGSLYVVLRLLQGERLRLWTFVVLGVCLGAAALTKFTAVLALPVVFVALAYHGWAARVENKSTWWRGWVLAALVCVAICGWHYALVWRELGHPLAGHSKWAYGQAWWQENGYRTVEYYLRGGRCFIQPLFSGFDSFFDGVYSTLWGDGLCSGVVSIAYRPPWNYPLMCAAYVLAVLPTFTILIGAALTVWSFVRSPSVTWFLVLGSMAGFATALVYMSLAVPGYGETRASFGLLTIVSFCALGAVGLEACLQKWRWLRWPLLGWLLLWAFTSYASLWIRGGQAPARVLKAGDLFKNERFEEAVQAATAALRVEPTNAIAASILSSALTSLGRDEEALAMAEKTVHNNPDNPTAHLNLAAVLRARERTEEAAVHLQRAIQLAPDHPFAYGQLAGQFLLLQRTNDAVAICRQGLRVRPWDSELHELLALARGDGRTVGR